MRSGVCVQGANVENAAYPVGTCAERVALGAAVVQVGLIFYLLYEPDLLPLSLFRVETLQSAFRL